MPGIYISTAVSGNYVIPPEGRRRIDVGSFPLTPSAQTVGELFPFSGTQTYSLGDAGVTQIISIQVNNQSIPVPVLVECGETQFSIVCGGYSTRKTEFIVSGLNLTINAYLMGQWNLGSGAPSIGLSFYNYLIDDSEDCKYRVENLLGRPSAQYNSPASVSFTGGSDFPTGAWTQILPANLQRARLAVVTGHDWAAGETLQLCWAQPFSTNLPSQVPIYTLAGPDANFEWRTSDIDFCPNPILFGLSNAAAARSLFATDYNVRR